MNNKYNDFLEKEVHWVCPNYDWHERPIIEFRQILIKEIIDYCEYKPVIVFIIEGDVQVSANDDEKQTIVQQGKMFLLPPNMRLHIQCLKNVSLLFCQMKKNAFLCRCLKIENLYNKKTKIHFAGKKKDFVILDINQPIQLCIEGMIKPLQDGLKCVYYLENKTEEIMLLMRAYYPRELLAEFFSSLSHDYLAFKTSINENRDKRLSVKDLAEMNHSSISGFHHRFKKIMGTTPSRWKNEERVKLIFHELMTSDKPLKQISDEQGFQSISYFNKFCKKHLGKPPGQIRKEK